MESTDQPHSQPPSDSNDAERVLQALLGRTSPEELAAVQTLLANSPELARTARILRDLLDEMPAIAREGFEPTPAAVLERAKALASLLPRPPSWLNRLKAEVLARIDATAGGLAAGFALAPALRGGQQRTLSSFRGSGLRIDAESTRAADGAYVLRIQLDADDADSLAGDFAVLDATSGAVLASGVVDADGAARATIPAALSPLHAVEIAVQCRGRTVVAAEVPLA
jgi:hypothetical protein